jgi:hypothetical protein
MKAEYNLIWFNSHKNIAIKEMWEKKRKYQTRTQDVTEFGFKNAYASGTLNLQQLRLSRNTKNSFTLIELGPLHKNELPSLSITRVTTHSKIRSEWQHTKKCEHYSSTRVENYSSRKCLQENHEGSSWENREKLDWA